MGNRALGLPRESLTGKQRPCPSFPGKGIYMGQRSHYMPEEELFEDSGGKRGMDFATMTKNQLYHD